MVYHSEKMQSKISKGASAVWRKPRESFWELSPSGVNQDVLNSSCHKLKQTYVKCCLPGSFLELKSLRFLLEIDHLNTHCLRGGLQLLKLETKLEMKTRRKLETKAGVYKNCIVCTNCLEKLIEFPSELQTNKTPWSEHFNLSVANSPPKATQENQPVWEYTTFKQFRSDEFTITCKYMLEYTVVIKTTL